MGRLALCTKSHPKTRRHDAMGRAAAMLVRTSVQPGAMSHQLVSLVARVCVWLGLCVAALAAQAQTQAPLASAVVRGELLGADAAADALPRDAGGVGTPLTASGPALQLTLPYRDIGSWVRLQLLSPLQQPVLVIETPTPGLVTVVMPDGRRLTRSKLHPPDDPNVSSLALAFDLQRQLKPGDEVWLHFEHQIRIPVSVLLLEESQWRQRERQTLITTSVICASLLAFALVALCYWVVLRRPMFAYYVLYVLSLVLFIASSTGFVYAWPGGALWALTGIHGQWALGACAIALSIGFSRHFLSVDRHAPRLLPIFHAGRRTGFALAVLALLSPWTMPWFGGVLGLLVLVANFFLIGVGVLLAGQGNRYAWYYLAGWVPLTITTTLRGLQGLGISTPYAIGHFYGLGAFCEAFILTLGIADQVLSIRRERDLALHAAAQAAQLELQNETLKENVRLREEVDRMSRHDLKTPLNSIVAVPDLMREEGNLSRAQLELMTLVERAGYRVLNMVNLSMDLLKMEQGVYQWQPDAVDIGRLIHRVNADVQRLAATREVRLRVVIDGQAPADASPVFVNADETLCYSILANLLKNAVEAAPDGSTVRVTVRSGDPVCIEIHNLGAVPADIRGRFFQKYATHGKASGTGFGAYSAQLMARIQQGELRMRTSDEEGTTLTLQLQAAAPDDAEATTFEHTLPGLPSDLAPLEPSVLHPLRVMVVDDDEHNLFVLRRYLDTPAVSRLRSAMNGREALEALMAEPTDVVLMDLEMPVMTGLEAVAALRSHEEAHGLPPALCVALTSHADASTRSRALEAGFDLYLTKPVKRHTLHRLLKRHAAESHPPAETALDAQTTVVLDADLKDALAGFLASRKEALREMVRAVHDDDRSLIRGLAHRMAGSFALYGYQWASQACQRLELDADKLAPAEALNQLSALLQHLDSVRVVFSSDAGG
jgi:signal transduction histidine kinase/CheY-like chemotaxis protein/HPt (histidine-containing phosphotransfer) domain-containing protein